MVATAIANAASSGVILRLLRSQREQGCSPESMVDLHDERYGCRWRHCRLRHSSNTVQVSASGPAHRDLRRRNRTEGRMGNPKAGKRGPSWDGFQPDRKRVTGVRSMSVSFSRLLRKSAKGRPRGVGATKTTSTLPTAFFTWDPAFPAATLSLISAQAIRSIGDWSCSRGSTTCSIANTTRPPSLARQGSPTQPPSLHGRCPPLMVNSRCDTPHSMRPARRELCGAGSA